jgi:hypothetical protein
MPIPKAILVEYAAALWTSLSFVLCRHSKLPGFFNHNQESLLTSASVTGCGKGGAVHPAASLWFPTDSNQTKLCFTHCHLYCKKGFIVEKNRKSAI